MGRNIKRDGEMRTGRRGFMSTTTGMVAGTALPKRDVGGSVGANPPARAEVGQSGTFMACTCCQPSCETCQPCSCGQCRSNASPTCTPHCIVNGTGTAVCAHHRGGNVRCVTAVPSSPS